MAQPSVGFLQRNSFWLERLQSLCGVVPLGAFILVHFYENGKALQGAAQYNETSLSIRTVPFLFFFELIFIYLPLLFHTIYGLRLFGLSHYNNRRYGYRRNAFFLVQRITGIILIFFIGFHVWTFRFGQFLNAPPTYDGVVSQLANPVVFIWFLIGILAVGVHLSNGVWSFLVRWGITVGPEAQHRSAYVIGALGALLTAAGWSVAIAFFVGARQVASLHGLPS